MVKQPRATASSIKEQIGATVSLRTVQRGLNRAGASCVKPHKRPLLTSVHIAKRLSWARQHSEWTEEDWSKVIFSDETKIEVRDNCPKFVRVVDGHPLTKEHCENTVKHPVSVMIWACFSIHGTGRAFVIEETLNSEKYITEILSRRLIPQIQDWYQSNEAIFQQDNAPCHVSKRTMAFFENSEIQVLSWPPSSPDMNPIENLWAIIKNKIRARNAFTKQTIIASFIDIWHRDEDVREMCQKLVLSMPRRVNALLKAKGEHTKY